jgi:hypothetical protein
MKKAARHVEPALPSAQQGQFSTNQKMDTNSFILTALYAPTVPSAGNLSKMRLILKRSFPHGYSQRRG